MRKVILQEFVTIDGFAALSGISPIEKILVVQDIRV